MEFDLNYLNRDSKWPISNELYVSPENFTLNLPANIEFKIDESLVLDYFPWQIQIFRREDNVWDPLPTRFENGIAFAQSYELGYFAAFINLDATKEEFKYIPYSFDLKPAYPNPFNPNTTIEFDMPFESNVNVSVYDLEGRKIQELVNDVYQPGQYIVNWDAVGFSSGMYFIKMETLSYHKTNKVLLLK